jgi:hypothetical protein
MTPLRNREYDDTKRNAGGAHTFTAILIGIATSYIVTTY